ncbi:unnamed protein product [Anisakis simplex]|uniref:RPAP1_N domain-containing protein n=1 Tax=Anisakis simplex TaxID=6269 RepID=A0A0M3JBD4_ANISI|nr:unnamed protein product [Anisakis simplex]
MSDENEDAISKENDERIKSMTSDEILSAQREIVERFDPKLIEFLRTRSRKKASKAPATEENRKGMVRTQSRFKQIREMGSKNYETSGLENEQDSATDNVVIKEKLDSLEVFPAVTNQVNTNRIDDDNTTPYTRLAVEAVQLDFATKCLRTIIPRQQQNIVRLFDSFTKPLELVSSSFLRIHFCLW